MSTTTVFLAERPDFIATVAQWYFQQWGSWTPDNSLEKTIERIKGKLNMTHPPLHIVAERNGLPEGVGQLKLHEMKEFPERVFWMGSVYVPAESRGNGIASLISNRIAAVAKSFGIDEIYLQTERLDGGLYARLGWQPLERLHVAGVPVLVMRKTLQVKNPL